MQSSSIPKILRLSLAILFGLFLLTEFDGTRFRNALPGAYQYLPPGASVYLFSENIGRSWGMFARHFRSGMPELQEVFANSQEELFGLKLTDFRARAEAQCIFAVGPDLLREIGIDEDGEFGAGLYVYNFETIPAAMAVFSIHDRESLIDFVFKSESPRVSLTLLGTREGESPVEFQIRRSAFASYGRICDPKTRSLIAADSLTIRDSGQGLVFVPDVWIEGEFVLDCKAVYESGETGDCICELEGRVPRKCDVPANFGYDDLKYTDAAGDWRQEKIGGRVVDEIRGVTWTLLVTDDGYAAYYTRRTSLISLVYNARRNLELHLADHRTQEVQDLRRASRVFNQEALAGSINYPTILGSSSTPFIVLADEFSFDLIFEPIFESPKSTVFKRFLTTNPSEGRSIPTPTASEFALSVGDSHISYYLRYVLRYIDDKESLLDDSLGNLAHVVEDVLKTRPSEIAGYVVGLRQSLPLIVIGVEMKNEQAARSVIQKIQRDLREVRDMAILKNALATCKHLRPAGCATIESLTAPGIDILSPEPLDSWSSYAIYDNGISRIHELDDALFPPDSLNTGSSKLRIDYLAPAVTDNDFDHRLTELDITPDERTSIQNNQGRLVAHYDARRGTLWLANDGQALARSEDAIHRQGAEFEAAEGVGRYSNSIPKMQLLIRPAWFISRALETENTEEDPVDPLLFDFDRYRYIVFTIEPAGRKNAISATLRLVL